MPHRCMRQFGMFQDIPSDDIYTKDLHAISLQGKQDNDWSFMHRDHISYWDRRADHIVGGGANLRVGVIDGYD